MDKLGTADVCKYIKDECIQQKLSNKILSKVFTHQVNDPLFIELLYNIYEKKNDLHRIIIKILYYSDHEKDNQQISNNISLFDINMNEYEKMVSLYDEYIYMVKTANLINNLKQN